MRKALAFIIPVVICFLVGFTGSMFQDDSIATWYPQLNKPELTPPNIVFPIAWSILYLCMGLSAGFVILSESAKKRSIITLFVLQLFFNFTWSILFFYLQNPLAGMINIIILDIFVIWYAIKSYQASKTASILFIPYILWLLFASYLNGYILLFN